MEDPFEDGNGRGETGVLALTVYAEMLSKDLGEGTRQEPEPLVVSTPTKTVTWIYTDAPDTHWPNVVGALACSDGDECVGDAADDRTPSVGTGTRSVICGTRSSCTPESNGTILRCGNRTKDGSGTVERVRLRSWVEIGGRVAAARERAGFTQRELGDRLGLHRSAVTRIELGQRQLDALELAQLAEALGRSVEWFLTEPPATIASHRDDLSADHDVRLLEEELERTSRDVELLTDINALSVPAATLQPGVTTLSEAETGAREARVVLGRGDGPLIDLQEAVESLGLLAFSLELGPGVIDGGYVRVGHVGVALINGSAEPGRRRFNLAHELGHHLLADEYTTDFGLGTTRADREALINAFAIHFLMPRSSFQTRWSGLSAQWDDVRHRLVVLAAEYRVSWSAAISHAMNLELISRGEFELLKVRRPTSADYLEVGVRFGEELQPVALAPAYSQAAVRSYRRGVISADRTIELLRRTVKAEDLPRPHETPIDALATEFETIER
jgi:Zn-dependent peptidase ImmA (M78 family)/DNA-binding XRE family transcriptional regulator